MAGERFIFKVASEDHEFEQIHRLNYRMFVEEIPQHPPHPEGRLVDRFHHENTYLIAMSGGRLAGMVAIRDKRPFSLDAKVADLESHLPSGTLCEIRLLGVEPPYRRSGLFAALMRYAARRCISDGYSVAVASGTTRQQKLYSRMGFVPFAAEVGSGEARFQPMYLTLPSAFRLLDRLDRIGGRENPEVNVTPGPVQVSREVQEAVKRKPLSHRSNDFLEMVAETKRLLCRMTAAGSVELLLGSGTLANDVVGAQLRLLEKPGVVLSNGEFGNRLVDHAARQGLVFEVVQNEWGCACDVNQLEKLLEQRPELSWVWATHCETSTGVLNDLPALKAACLRNSVLLCMDCTSSLGTVPVDLTGVYLASSVSGKGLAALPGIAMVFYHHQPVPDRRLPRYLDLGLYAMNKGVPFTHSSNLLAAVRTSLFTADFEERFERIRRQYRWLRNRLETGGFSVVAADSLCSPAVLTLRLSSGISSALLGETLEGKGFLLSFRSSYLIDRNLIQICLMGEVSDEECRSLVDALVEAARRPAATLPPGNAANGRTLHELNRQVFPPQTR